jgi:hypothetical protein
MAKAGKKGGGFLDNMVSAGIGAYAAKSSGSVSDLLFTLFKYALVIIGILLVVGVVANLLGATEKFTILPNSPTDPRYPGVAVAPTESQESGYVRTPAGNVYRT